MATIFISYNRESKYIIKILVDDFKALGHTVWFDKELSGGQAWWDQILSSARKCDVFVFILDPKSLKSSACKREYNYAADLGKPILPVLVAEGVSMNLLPPSLSKIQFVDYRKQDRDAVLRLARAMRTLPPAAPLPDPLPTPPEVPISYLGSLTEKVETVNTLTYEEQSVLLVDLKRSLRNPETTDDALVLLKKLRNRRDLYATIAMEIDELLSGRKKEEPVKSQPQTIPTKESLPKTAPVSIKKESSPPAPPPQIKKPILSDNKSIDPDTRMRLISALLGAIFGYIIGAMGIVIFVRIFHGVIYYNLVVPIVVAAGGAIAGAISGTNRRIILASLIGLLVGYLFSFIFFRYHNELSISLALGAILGAIVGRKLSNSKATTSNRNSKATTSYRKRLISALIGAVLGYIVGFVWHVILYGGLPDYDEIYEYTLLVAVGGAIAGAISGANQRIILSSIIGLIMGYFIASYFTHSFDAIIFGVPSGAIIGAIVGAILSKRLKWE